MPPWLFSRLALEIGLGALLVGVLAVGWHEHSNRLIAEGERRAAVAHSDSILKVVTPERLRVDTLVQHQTRTVLKTVDQVRTLRDTVILHLTDTVRVKELIAKTDTALAACTDLTNSCAAFRRNAVAEIAALNEKVRSAVSVPAKSCTVPAVLGALVGVGGGYLLKR